MKYVVVFLFLSFQSSHLFAQWTTSGSNINFTAGIVSIGTIKAPVGFKLAVGGSIISEEVVIKLQSAWPDYVFDEPYKLTPLDDLECFIRQHKHLPEVPSANEIENDGIKIGEMNAILLKKIEELTLHVIALKHEIDELKK